MGSEMCIRDRAKRGVGGAPIARVERAGRWSDEVGLAYAPWVVAFASLVFPFGVTASRRSGCASRVPEDKRSTVVVFIKSSLKKRGEEGRDL